jgi:hypothetical protein
MAITMSRSTRDEYLEKMRCRYRRYTGKLARSRLLDEFCEVTGHERKYATKLLSGRRGPPSGGSGGAGLTPSRGGRPPIYDAEVTGVLHEIWKHSEQPCGKRLKPMLGTWLPFYERRYGTLAAKIRDGVLSISAAQIDRVLAPRKIGAGIINRRTPKAHAAIKALVPVRAECWDAREPGWIEADTVAHCGGDMGGSFLWSLTATDIFSGWTEVRATWNRGQYGVCAAFVEIEGELPFALLGVDTDNGGEFLNHHLHRHFRGREKPVEMTRSRPYHKNDQAHVEQKNSTHVRQLLGFERLGHDLVVPLVTGLLEAWSIWRNAYTTTFKQTECKRIGSKTVRRHEKVPKTPCDRLIEYREGSGDSAAADALRAWRDVHDPFELKDWIEERMETIWKLDAALNFAQSEGETDLEGVAAPFLRGLLRYAPKAPQKRKPARTSSLKTKLKPPTQKNATESPKAA